MEEQFFIRTLVKCNGSLRDENLDAPVTEVESITRDEAFDLCNNEYVLIPRIKYLVFMNLNSSLSLSHYVY